MIWPTTYLSSEECQMGCGLRIHSGDPRFYWPSEPEPLPEAQLIEIESALERRIGDKRLNYQLYLEAGDSIPTTNSVISIPWQESDKRYMRVVQVKSVSPNPPHPDKPYSIYIDGTLLPTSYTPVEETAVAPTPPKRQVGRPRKVRSVSYAVAEVAQ
jgi:hypothetical protein